MNTSFPVFLQLIATIKHIHQKKGYDDDQAVNISHFLYVELLELGLTAEQVRDLKAYIDRNRKPDYQLLSDININTKKLREITQNLYETLCNSIGPVKTDGLYAEAIAIVEKSKLATLFSPRELF